MHNITIKMTKKKKKKTGSSQKTFLREETTKNL